MKQRENLTLKHNAKTTSHQSKFDKNKVNFHKVKKRKWYEKEVDPNNTKKKKIKSRIGDLPKVNLIPLFLFKPSHDFAHKKGRSTQHTLIVNSYSVHNFFFKPFILFFLSRKRKTLFFLVL